MASGKTELARAGTMQVTAQEGTSYLDRNLTDWKKPYLLPEGDEASPSSAPEKPALSKATTMKETAKAGEAFLKASGAKVDADAGTRGQQKKIDDIQSETPAAKKARLARDNTMAATAKEGKALLKGENLADTRKETTAKRKSVGNVKRASTINATMDEAKAVYGNLDLSEGRRTRSGGKPNLGRAGTMQKTAKEGKAFLKKTKKAAPKKEEKIEEKAEDESKEVST